MLIQITKEAPLLPPAGLPCLPPSSKRSWVVPTPEANTGSEQRIHVGLEGKAWVVREGATASAIYVPGAWGGEARRGDSLSTPGRRLEAEEYGPFLYSCNPHFFCISLQPLFL